MDVNADEEDEDEDGGEEKQKAGGPSSARGPEAGWVNYRFASNLLAVWQKQPSPCCAGASLSCCINALRGDSRENGLSVLDGCSLIADAMRQRGSFFTHGLPRRLQVDNLQQLLEAVRVTLGSQPLRSASKIAMRQGLVQVALGGRFRMLTALYEHHRRAAASGLKWVDAGPKQPDKGRELVHSKLAEALTIGNEFTTQEWEAFGIQDLRMDHRVQSGKSYFRPAAAKASLLPVVDDAGANAHSRGLPLWAAQKATCECGACAWDCGVKQRKQRGFCDCCGGRRAEQCLECGKDLCVACLFPQRCNDDGFLVTPGDDVPRLLYCGRVTVAGAGSGERCGPHSGPQCDSCLRFQAEKRLDGDALGERLAASWGRGWDWECAEEELLEWLLREKIQDQLREPDHPSTWKVGNRGLMDGAFLVDGIHAARFMGVSSPKDAGVTEHVLSSDDTVEEVNAQWQLLKDVFATNVLIFHLTNHYCPIYAWREIGVERQVLTSRFGQRPREWLSWSECRQIMLKWFGYKIMRLTYNAEIQAQ